ncbi:kinase-like domain-containing protein [Glomus cerebriforme]|uniref:Kinase-like domain-containing protein n=1 Tax=Glomus cerebriforme TaxID=658196 RepID=A0A397T3W3_9GLOM|nr:kinase-like domain-containing protein [Glomus cerebriforme]
MVASIRENLIYASLKRIDALIEPNISNDLTKMHEFRTQKILAEESLTQDEKLHAIMILNKEHDFSKIISNMGTKRICENCHLACLATLYCEHCIRNYLTSNFSNWSSGNIIIDDLIQKCQMEIFGPDYVTEWIPYNNLQNIEYLTKGGYSEIYLADWIGGKYLEWDSKKQLLKREGTRKVVLKKLDNVESTERSWFDEAQSHLTISNKWSNIVHCFGLTQDPLNGNYMLVMEQLDMNLRKYLQQNHNKLTWNNKIKIAYDLIYALSYIHKEKAIHRDLHSGNILYAQYNDYWYISDLGFCGPVDKPLGSIYGNLPYIAPEVISGKKYSYASDIYSIGILMWEISAGQPPFADLDYDYDLAMDLVNGMRPDIASDVPLEYKEIMEQCWDADPKKRPNINIIKNKISDINSSYYQNNTAEDKVNNYFKNIIKNFFNVFQLNIFKSNYLRDRTFASKFYEFKNFPEPKNAIEEKEEFHSRYSFNIPYEIEGFDNENSYNISNSGLIKNKFNKLFGTFKKLHINSTDVDIPISYKRETIRQQIKRQNIGTDDVYDDANFHSEEQDELEIPDGKLLLMQIIRIDQVFCSCISSGEECDKKK